MPRQPGTRAFQAFRHTMLGGSAMLLPGTIIGAGLAGVRAARLLHEAGVGFRIFEALDRRGGRIRSADTAGRPAEDGFDLGPSRFCPGMHLAMAATVAERGLAAFSQHDEEDVLVEHQPNRPPRRLGGFRQEPRSMRLAGGTAALVRALAAALPEGSICLWSQVTELACDRDHVRLALRPPSGETERILARQVIAALRPRLHEATITFQPAIDPATRLRWRDTPTRMAPYATFVALYARPFWREAGLSAMAQSMVDPMDEVHDATTALGGAALFGAEAGHPGGCA